MVRDVQCIWYGITYAGLKKVLKENRKLKYLPLVDKPGKLQFLVIILFFFLTTVSFLP